MNRRSDRTEERSNDSPSTTAKRFRWRRSVQIIGRILVLAVFLAGGCKSSSKTNTASTAQPSKSGDVEIVNSSEFKPNTPLLNQVEREYVIGPMAAGDMDYRVAWQANDLGARFKHFSVQGDSVFTLDRQNSLSRVKIADGQRVWRMQVAAPIEDVLGVTFDSDRVYVTTGGAVLVLDAGTGSQIGRQELLQVANTKPVLFGPFLVYGTRNGQLAWHNGRVGAYWRGYQVANTMLVPPVLHGGILVAVGDNGNIMALNAANVTQLWGKQLLRPVVTAPAVGDQAVYAAGTDQYIWAFDLMTGRNLWKVLTESALTDSPTLIEDRVYQQVPRHGLYCFEALPPDSPGGVLVWNSPSVNGNVLLKRRSNLYAWDKNAHQITLVDVTRGAIVRNIALPQAQHIVVNGGKQTDIYAASDDGRVVRLVPRN